MSGRQSKVAFRGAKDLESVDEAAMSSFKTAACIELNRG
jgi:hypothetical protein